MKSAPASDRIKGQDCRIHYLVPVSSYVSGFKDTDFKDTDFKVNGFKVNGFKDTGFKVLPFLPFRLYAGLFFRNA